MNVGCVLEGMCNYTASGLMLVIWVQNVGVSMRGLKGIMGFIRGLCLWG